MRPFSLTEFCVESCSSSGSSEYLTELKLDVEFQGAGLKRERRGEKMANWSCFCWNRSQPLSISFEPEPFSLPSPLPSWPQGGNFAKGIICIGELEIMQIKTLEGVYSCSLSNNKSKGATFFKPTQIPSGFFTLGHYAQPNKRPLHGFLLVVREAASEKPPKSPPLLPPVDFSLVWSSKPVDFDLSDGNFEGCGFFWVPVPPTGYRALGFLVTKTPDKPSLDEVRCVRCDLTEDLESHELIFDGISFKALTTRPRTRSMWTRGIAVGTFFFISDNYPQEKDDLGISCLKNTSSSYLQDMPNLDQVNALVNHYGPTLFFHPEEIYLPSSVSWFFKNGALLCQRGYDGGRPIEAKGLNLPAGGCNDGEFWIDLNSETADEIKKGNIESCKLYVHVKPAVGGTFTDLAMWVFCPFNGPGTARIGPMSIPFKRVGEHIGDWEHFTLRVSNFNGELWSIYFSQHSGGEWVDASELEFLEGNKAVVYSARSGHASFPHAGDFLQGSEKLGIGMRNETARSKFFVDSSVKYEIISAEYLGDTVEEPCWLQYMREWGPTIVYNSRSELEKIIRFLPFNLRFSVENIFAKLPVELYGEEGPTGPKEKNMWEGDERS